MNQDLSLAEMVQTKIIKLRLLSNIISSKKFHYFPFCWFYYYFFKLLDKWVYDILICLFLFLKKDNSKPSRYDNIHITSYL